MCVAAQTYESPTEKRSRMRIDLLVHKGIEGHGHQSAQPCDLADRYQLGPGALEAHDPHRSPPAWAEKSESMGSPHDASRAIGSVTNVRQQFEDKGRHEQVHVCRVEPTADKCERPLCDGKGKWILGILKRAHARNLGNRAGGTDRLAVRSGTDRRFQKLGLRNNVERASMCDSISTVQNNSQRAAKRPPGLRAPFATART